MCVLCCVVFYNVVPFLVDVEKELSWTCTMMPKFHSFVHILFYLVLFATRVCLSLQKSSFINNLNCSTFVSLEVDNFTFFLKQLLGSLLL